MQDSYDPEPSVTTTTSYDISDSLPQGWSSHGTRPEGRTPLILALSLALAFLICFFMIGCLFWRKNMKRKFKESQDIEMKARKRPGSDVDPAEHSRLIVEKDAKVKQKLWARATARWKANARYSARQRRGKRIVTSTRSPANYSATSLEHHLPQEELSSAHSSRHSSPSRSSSRRPSVDNHLEDPPGFQGTELSSEIEPTNSIPAISLSPPHVTHSSPPAYRQRGQGLHIPLENLSMSDCDQSRHSPSFSSAPHSPGFFPNPHSRRPSHASLHSPFFGSEVQLEPDTYESPIHSAHVAIDDKTVLARLVNFASSPPQSGSNNVVESSNPLSSAPEWHDEELEDFDRHYDSPMCRSRSSSPVGLFPAPPSKGKMAAADFLQYSLTFEEEMAALDPETEPSAPPFEAEINCDHEILAPSAPPLLDDDQDVTEYPCAPAWDSPPDMHVDEQSNDHHSGDEPARGRSPNSQPVEGPATLDGDLPDYLP
ncbi:hypothetical protein BDQ17DRAFT_1341546 [Cyathus striatus]|nr:hypothetical protein BDQ17DRAFT_1341546 [Cyathus striatus]